MAVACEPDGWTAAWEAVAGVAAAPAPVAAQLAQIAVARAAATTLDAKWG
ncbi:MAG TPA: hypothetical protein VHR45_10100 [Thermoanaerobaculia bacterium]|nr:hypothetical protein [Thermoanaerobaculia bacterium]